MGLVSQLVS